MKIGIDARFFRSSTAGLGRYSQALIKGLAKIDKQNQYIIYLTKDDIKEYKNCFNAKKINAKNFTPKVVPITHYSLNEQTKFLKMLNEDNLDLVHFLNFNHPIAYRKKFITTVHDLTIMFFPVGRQQKSNLRRWAFKSVMSSAVKNSERVIAISKATEADIIRVFGTKKEKIDVVYEGIDKKYNPKIRQNSHQIAQFRKKYQLDQPYLFFLSQWRPHKGLPELIRAYEILRERYKIPHILVVGGKPNKSFPEISHAISKSGYRKKIILPGFIPEAELPYFYALADAFIFPSKYEGFGLPPLEAMSVGTPVIASDKSCMPEILGKAAAYFDPNNPQAIAQKINEVVSNKATLETMSQSGLQHVKQYSWTRMARQTLEIYKQVL